MTLVCMLCVLPETKALILGAVFLIDFMYFEDNQPVQRGRGGGGSWVM